MKIDNAKIRTPSKDLKPKENYSNRISVFQESNRHEIQYIDVTVIKSFKHQSREIFDKNELDSLSRTIKEHGVRQPLTVLHCSNDTYEVVSGERRLKAAILAGLKKVPCIIIRDETKAEELSLIENVQRKDLTLMELGRGIAGLLERGVFASQSELSEGVGIPRTKITECISLTKLPLDIQKKIIEKNINNRDQLRDILRLSSIEQQVDFINNFYNVKNTDKSYKSISKSILRYSFKNGDLRVQKSGIKYLSKEEKDMLKRELFNIIEIL